MDRFIENITKHLSRSVYCLKSNMDRFIEESSSKYQIIKTV